MNIQTFSPGNNLWEKMPRLIFFSFERLIIMAIDFGITYIGLNMLFAYNWSVAKVGFLIIMVVLGIFMMLPAPSNPLKLMWSEVLVRPFVGYRQKAINGSVVIEPLEREEL